MRLGGSYRPRPSATRRGQMVDDPPLQASDTGRMKALLLEETQDDWHAQDEFNRETEKRLTTLFTWRTNLTEREKGFAQKPDITLLLWMVGAIGFAATVVAGYMFHLLERQQDTINQLLQATRP